MSHRSLVTLCCGLTVLGCSRGRPEPDAGAPATRGAFGAASSVTAAEASADPKAFRVVPLRPMTGDVEMLFGHPDTVGRPFVMRIRELPGTMVPPHSHPVDEHLTVVSGTWYFGVGERFDSMALRKLEVGAYAFAPAGTTMFAYSPDGGVVQVHGVGPFHITWRHGLAVLDEPGAAVVFRFRKGEMVDTPRGVGRIEQGYASGTIIQYQIEGVDGTRFMADESRLRRR